MESLSEHSVISHANTCYDGLAFEHSFVSPQIAEYISAYFFPFFFPVFRFRFSGFRFRFLVFLSVETPPLSAQTEMLNQGCTIGSAANLPRTVLLTRIVSQYFCPGHSPEPHSGFLSPFPGLVPTLKQHCIRGRGGKGWQRKGAGRRPGPTRASTLAPSSSCCGRSPPAGMARAAVPCVAGKGDGLECPKCFCATCLGLGGG